MKKLVVINPKLSQDKKTISAWFTTKNTDYFEDGRNIPGLNLGYNTSEDRAIVDKNRLILYQALGIKPNQIALVKQIHGNRVLIVNKGGYYQDADALVTNISGLTLGIQVADCAAVLLADEVNKVVGAAHAGWRGALSGIVQETVKKMVDSGASVKNIQAYVSPCISASRFEVGIEVAEQFPEEFVDYEHYSKPHVDLKAFIKNELTQFGLKNEYIEIDPNCTQTDTREFYSYRREKGKSGRMMGLIRIN